MYGYKMIPISSAARKIAPTDLKNVELSLIFHTLKSAMSVWSNKAFHDCVWLICVLMVITHSRKGIIYYTHTV